MSDQTQLAHADWSRIKRQLDSQLTNEDMGQKIRELLGHAYSENTLKGYKSSLAHFIRWSGHNDPFPVSPEIVMVYLATFSDTLAPTTLDHRLAALSFIHKYKEYPDPTENKHVTGVMRGIRNKRAGENWTSHQATPFTLTDIRTMVSSMSDSKHDIRDRAFILTGLIGAFRTSELCSIDMNHVLEFDKAIVIPLDATKNDPMNTYKKYKVLPKIDGAICPVTALNRWLSVSNITDGYIFRGINKHGELLGNRLSHTSANSIIKKWANYLPGKSIKDYSGTSLRSSFITIARQLRIPDEVIIKQTLHQSTKTLNIYDRPDMDIEDSAANEVLDALNAIGLSDE